MGLSQYLTPHFSVPEQALQSCMTLAPFSPVPEQALQRGI
jgi:hypothetical protein